MSLTAKPWLRPTTSSLADDDALLRTFTGHTDHLTACALTPEGFQAVSASMDHTLKLWDLASGVCLRTFTGHLKKVRDCVVTPDGHRIISTSDDKTLKLWDLGSGICLRTFMGHSDSVKTCAVTSDGVKVVSASDDGTLKLWNLASGECLHTYLGDRNLKGLLNSPDQIFISFDESKIASISAAGDLNLWDMTSGKCLRSLREKEFTLTSYGHQDGFPHTEYALKLWDLVSGTCEGIFKGSKQHSQVIFLSPDRRYFTLRWDRANLELFDLDDGDCFYNFVGHGFIISDCDVTHDGRNAISVSWDQTLKLWDLDVAFGASINEKTNFRPNSGIGHFGKVLHSHYIFSTSDYTFKLWDLDSGECLRTFVGHSGSVNACAVTPDGHHIVSASNDKTLRLWDLVNGECLRIYVGHSDSVKSCVVTPDGYLIISGGDSSIRFWDLATGELKRTILSNYSVESFAITPDWRKMIIDSGEILRTLDLENGKFLGTCRKGYVTSAWAMTPDGAYIVIPSNIKDLAYVLTLWDLETVTYLRTFGEHERPIEFCTFTPDGKLVITGSWDKTLKIWDFKTGKLMVVFNADRFLECGVISDGHTIYCHGLLSQLHILRLEGMPSTNGTTNNRITG